MESTKKRKTPQSQRSVNMPDETWDFLDAKSAEDCEMTSSRLIRQAVHGFYRAELDEFRAQRKAQAQAHTA